MAKTLKFRIHNCRSGGQYALMAFDLGIGYELDGQFVGVLDVRGLFLKEKKDGSGNFVSFPSKPRLDKETREQLVDAKGYKVYDNDVDLYMEKGANSADPEKRAPTEAGWNFRRWLIEEATEQYTQLQASDAGRGTAKAAKPAARPAPAATRSAPAPRPAAAPTKVTDGFEGGDEEDDDLPF